MIMQPYDGVQRIGIEEPINREIYIHKLCCDFSSVFVGVTAIQDVARVCPTCAGLHGKAAYVSYLASNEVSRSLYHNKPAVCVLCGI